MGNTKERQGRIWKLFLRA